MDLTNRIMLCPQSVGKRRSTGRRSTNGTRSTASQEEAQVANKDPLMETTLLTTYTDFKVRSYLLYLGKVKLVYSGGHIESFLLEKPRLKLLNSNECGKMWLCKEMPIEVNNSSTIGLNCC